MERPLVARDHQLTAMTPGRHSIGVDIGGTFTDVVCTDGQGGMRLLKVPTTRGAPGVAVRTALEQLAREHGVAPASIDRFAHGTTVATNAVLERKGARTGLLATEGFRDVLEIGRSFRPNMYDLFVRQNTPTFLAPRSRRQPVRERIGPAGEVLTPLDPASLDTAIRALLDEGVGAIAVAFLFSFANPAHELLARDAILAASPGLPVSLSHEVDPAFREYERTCITAFDAYVKPGLIRYVNELEADLAAMGVPAPLQVMQSRGGLSSAAVALERPVRLFLSGPAAGVIGGRAAGRLAGEADLVTFDVGGTSCDIALVQGGQPVVRPTGTIDGYVVRVPMVDVNAIGAGGGSIAWIDDGGGLRVGPHSAGSEPGPACYARGGEQPTVTDASVVLGYIDPGYFAGGTLRLDPDRAREAVAGIAGRLGLSPEAAALGIHRVVTAQMAEGIRLVSVKRGIDPRGFTLVPLGGGGGIHATALARDLGMRRILVPRYPGVLAACGLLDAPVEHEVATAFGKPMAAASAAELGPVLAALDRRCADLMAKEGVGAGSYAVAHAADICYVGQSHPIEVPIDDGALAQGLQPLYEAFLAAHERIHGHGERGPARFVNLRSVATAQSAGSGGFGEAPSCGPTVKGHRAVLFAGTPAPVRSALVDRAALAAGDTVLGPAVLEQADTTTLVDPGWRARVVAGGALLMELGEGVAA